MHTQKEVVEAWLGGLPCESRGTITDGRTLWSKDETDDDAREAPPLGARDDKGMRWITSLMGTGAEPRRVWLKRWRAADRSMRAAQTDCAGGEAVRKTRGSE